MIRQPSDKKEALNFYLALNIFKSSESGKTILKHLESERNRLRDKNDNEDEERKFRQVQGANQTLSKLLKMVDTSNTEVQKLR